ncbi:unnamed protein product [Vitrella brassicaformis CCMP3155]|uniref:Carboxylesterase type B domain-containing protein n=2 Tax=Vitrella brassicaformis TaxID=1169539 RepID=A0A0G4FEZ9_VITBC|nr:unnamed protein product [Vitrella brassicaformis CCMP3155]|eukprot:CEM11758.1 unnamed protein product [Vitrella brassicaformis CCMP3155]
MIRLSCLWGGLIVVLCVTRCATEPVFIPVEDSAERCEGGDKADLPDGFGCVRFDPGESTATVGRDEGEAVEFFLGIQYATAERFEPATERVYGEDDAGTTINGEENQGDACVSGCKLTIDTPDICEAPNGVESEECLFLSIWRPQDESLRTTQIIIILHGGGFLAGTGMADFVYAEEVARRTGALVASVNYRLGVLGWLSSFTTEPNERPELPGNYGLTDAWAVLRWLERYATFFVGEVCDKGSRLCDFSELSLNLWGFSAGAKLAACVLTSPVTPLATNLPLGQIEQVILSSGSWGLPDRAGPLLTVQTEAILKTLECIGLFESLKVDANGAFVVREETIECLKNADVEKIRLGNAAGLAAIVVGDFSYLAEPYSPVGVAPFLPDTDCVQDLKEGKFYGQEAGSFPADDRPRFLITGGKNEGTLFIRAALDLLPNLPGSSLISALLSAKSYVIALLLLFGPEDAKCLLREYPANGKEGSEPANGPGSAPDTVSSVSSAYGDYYFSCSARALCKALAGSADGGVVCYGSFYESGWDFSTPEFMTNAKSPQGGQFDIYRSFCFEPGITCHLEEQMWVLGNGERIFPNFDFSEDLEEDVALTLDEPGDPVRNQGFLPIVKNFIDTGFPFDPTDNSDGVWPPFTEDAANYVALSDLIDGADNSPVSFFKTVAQVEQDGGFKIEECACWDEINPDYDATWLQIKKRRYDIFSTTDAEAETRLLELFALHGPPAKSDCVGSDCIMGWDGKTSPVN